LSIEYAILGLLSWKPFSGYDLKKVIAESDVYYWSGNNNQIYNSLVALHKQGLVSQEVQYQESLPAKKLYTITEQGQAAFRDWVRSSPELPELRSTFLVQLAWADALPADELDALLAQYEEEIAVQLRMQAARPGSRAAEAPNRTPRERYLWEKITEHQVAIYRHELEWVQSLRAGLGDLFERS
jgi:PadR family transcriptional regulator, regulatory protein AphA